MSKIDRRKRLSGFVIMMGGLLGIVLAPVMVTVKYMTGWSIIPQPVWVDYAIQIMGPLLTFGSPPQLWTVYGIGYTVALVMMLYGLFVLSGEMREENGRIRSKGFWVLLFGFFLVIPGDAVHTLTWHQNGLTIPTPGTNPVANTAYAVHMMGMNFVMIGSLIIGISALRKRFFATWFALFFVLMFPSAILASVTFLPTTPSGALWLFCLMMIAFGYTVMTGRSVRPHGETQPSLAT